MAYNKGLRSGFEKNESARRELVYVPISSLFERIGLGATGLTPYAQAIPDGTTKTADMALTLTDSVAGECGLPADGSIKGVHVMAIAQLNAVDSGTRVRVYGYGPKGNVAAGDLLVEVIPGKVSGHYDQADILFVPTDGRGRFWWNVEWVSGTVTSYLRVMGYWRLP